MLTSPHLINNKWTSYLLQAMNHRLMMNKMTNTLDEFLTKMGRKTMAERNGRIGEEKNEDEMGDSGEDSGEAAGGGGSAAGAATTKKGGAGPLLPAAALHAVTQMRWQECGLGIVLPSQPTGWGRFRFVRFFYSERKK